VVTFLSRKHVKYDARGNDVIIAVVSIASASELPADSVSDGVVYHEGSRAWDISTGDIYGKLSNTWTKQPAGFNLWIGEENVT